ncbi:MAG: deoxyhypusine synthase family protein [Planctomycetota bacterium]|nr:deoxyhypusine synthase family protein [Planctomycetota bacterium]
MDRHFRHFNARETLAAAKEYHRFVTTGGKMVVSLAGAMSTAEIGLTLAELIRRDKVHLISCTAANLEEDLFNATSHGNYQPTPTYRDLSSAQEVELRDQGFNRVTDTCIPESAIRKIEPIFIQICQENSDRGIAKLPYEIFFEAFDRNLFQQHFQIPLDDSWVFAAWQKGIQILTPGFEDCTLGNIFAARIHEGLLPDHRCLRHGTEQMTELVDWYLEANQENPVGFFQIGGGIAGDFAICAVPLIIQDLGKQCDYWKYFAQISDSTTSYGSYSGAVPREKITWHKLDENSQTFMINSDASIVAPLIFQYLIEEDGFEDGGLAKTC